MLMRTLTAAMLVIAATAPARIDAANIDDGYKQDGSTTYCQGVRGGTGAGAVAFPELFPHSLGRCPIEVALTVTPTTVHQNKPVDVTWKATARSGDIPNNIFPRAIDAGSKRPQNVVASYIKACKAGTNCGAVLDPTPVGPGEADAGAFNDKGVKDLRAYKFTFSDKGDYVIVGKVVLPGDGALNVSASEFIAFQKVTVVDPSTPISPTPSPSPSPSPSSNNSTSPSPEPSKTPAPKKDITFDTIRNESSGSQQGKVEAGTIVRNDDSSTPLPNDDTTSKDAQTKDAEGEKKSFFKSHGTLLIAVAGGCAVLFVIGYVFAMRRKNEQRLNQTKQDRIFRMDPTDQPDEEAMVYVPSKSARNTSTGAPNMAGRSNSSVDGPVDLSRRGSELEPSFDEGTVSEDNHVMPSPPDDTSSTQPDSTKPHLTTLYTPDRDPSLYTPETRETDLYQSSEDRGTEQRDYFASEIWRESDNEATNPREESSLSFAHDSSVSSPNGFSIASSYTDGSYGGTSGDFGSERLNSEASIDSYAFRPSGQSLAESYNSRYSLADSEFSREGSRISGISIFSDRSTNARHV